MNLKIGKATDGLVGNPKLKKPRYYVEIWSDGTYIAVVKVYTTDPTKVKDAEKLEKKLRKMIRNFNPTSAVDKRLYTKKVSGDFIKITDLDYESANNFQFDNSQSESLYNFIIEDPNNKKMLDELILAIEKINKKE